MNVVRVPLASNYKRTFPQAWLELLEAIAFPHALLCNSCELYYSQVPTKMYS